MPRLEKFFENALKESSSRNWMLEGEGLVDEEVPERRGFWAGVDLRLGAIDTTNVNRFRGRKREEQSENSQVVQIYQIYGKKSTYAWEMQNKKHYGLSPIQSYQHTSILHTSKCMKIPLKCKWDAMFEVLNTFK